MTFSFRKADDWDYALIRHDYPDDPSPPYWMEHHQEVVIRGDEEVALISWLDCQDQRIITQLYVFPDFRDQLVGAYILGILANQGHQCRVLCTPTTKAYYERQGFFQDHGHILLTKEPVECND